MDFVIEHNGVKRRLSTPFKVYGDALDLHRTATMILDALSHIAAADMGDRTTRVVVIHHAHDPDVRDWAES